MAEFAARPCQGTPAELPCMISDPITGKAFPQARPDEAMGAPPEAHAFRGEREGRARVAGAKGTRLVVGEYAGLRVR